MKASHETCLVGIPSQVGSSPSCHHSFTSEFYYSYFMYLIVLSHPYKMEQGLPGGSVVKNLSAMQKTHEMQVQIPGLGRSPGGGHDNPTSILALKIPWTEEPGGLRSMGSQRVQHD